MKSHSDFFIPARNDHCHDVILPLVNPDVEQTMTKYAFATLTTPGDRLELADITRPARKAARTAAYNYGKRHGVRLGIVSNHIVHLGFQPHVSLPRRTYDFSSLPLIVERTPDTRLVHDLAYRRLCAAIRRQRNPEELVIEFDATYLRVVERLPPDRAQLATDIEQVRDLLTPEGCWARNPEGVRRKDPRVGLCLTGAIYEVIPDEDSYRHRAIKEALGENYAEFNEDPSTTHAGVLTFLDERIATCARLTSR